MDSAGGAEAPKAPPPPKSATASRVKHLIGSQSLPSKQNTGFLIFKSLANAENQYRPK